MKKVLVIMLALFLAVPAMTYAGSATSRWDMTIGGFIKADFGYATNGLELDAATAPPESRSNAQNLADEYSNFYSGTGETRINFLVKGPEGWGAKTSAFLEWEFSGAYAGGQNYGAARMRHAFMKMDWANTSLLIGQYWYDVGMLFPDLLGRGEATPFNRGNRYPQIRLTQNISKDFKFFIGIMQPQDNSLQGTTRTVNEWSRSGLPWAFGELQFATDSCGKIGNDKMSIAVGGAIGQSKVTYAEIDAAAALTGRWKDDSLTSWMSGIRGFIPIIPEKKGNKANALFFKGNFNMGQNQRGAFNNGGLIDAYTYSAGASRDYSAPSYYSWSAQLGYYFTNQVWANVYYGQYNANLSNAARAVGVPANTIDMTSMYAGNVFYDVNPAIRFAFQYSHFATKYARVAASDTGVGRDAGKSGSTDSFRIAAFYFF